MKTSALIMGICPPERLRWLCSSVVHMDGQEFPFYRKVLAIDAFDGHEFPESLMVQFEARGWIVLVDHHKSRVKSMQHALQHTDSDLIFYNEDDVMVNLPDYEVVANVFDNIINDRRCGMLSMAIGGTTMDQSRGDFGDINTMDNRIIYTDDDMSIFMRDESMCNEWFFEFPGLFVRSSILDSCIEYAKGSSKGKQIETGLTEAYFKQGFNKDYFKCSLVKKDILSILKEDPFKINSHCRFLHNLDPLQGSSPLGGGHSF